MKKSSAQTVKCQICNAEFTLHDAIPGSAVHSELEKIILAQCPSWSQDGYICHEDLDKIRVEYVKQSLEEEKGALSELESEVLDALEKEETLSKNLNAEFEMKLSFGERIADKVAEFGGSWKFIIIFMTILVVWIIINSIALLKRPFDPYPYILLNLVLSCVAAIQAPVIMMSQNRQEAKDRMRSEHDYQVNLKAEIEIRNLSEKVDHLLHQEWQRLLEIQEIQTDLMRELAAKTKKSGDEE